MDGGEVPFVTAQLFHRFISSSNWLMKQTFGEEQRKEPKGRKNVKGGEKSGVDSCASSLSADCVSQMFTAAVCASSASPWRAAA